MSKWSPMEIIVALGLLALGWAVVDHERNADNRPDHIKFVEDTRNGCTLQQELPLFNHMVHVTKAEYKPKILRVYICANGLTAANISEE